MRRWAMNRQTAPRYVSRFKKAPPPTTADNNDGDNDSAGNMAPEDPNKPSESEGQAAEGEGGDEGATAPAAGSRFQRPGFRSWAQQNSIRYTPKYPPPQPRADNDETSSEDDSDEDEGEDSSSYEESESGSMEMPTDPALSSEEGDVGQSVDLSGGIPEGLHFGVHSAIGRRSSNEVHLKSDAKGPRRSLG